MKTHRNIARWMGILYLVGTIACILSRALTAPALNAADLPLIVAANACQFTLAALLMMTMGMALALIPMIAWPALRQHDVTEALK